MQIDPTELAQVAAAEAPRMDMYTGIHKALRAFMADTLMALGRMDCDDADEREQVAHRVLELLAFCRGHLEHENAFVHRAIEDRAPGASERVAHEHEEHVAAIERLADVVAVLRTCAPAQRFAAAQQLYRGLALFVAENFQHMHVEETAHNAVLWARYTDAELVAIHDALLASVPPDEMRLALRWLVPSMSPRERAMLVADLHAKAPPPVFEALMGVVRPHLTAGEWARLATDVGLPA